MTWLQDIQEPPPIAANLRWIRNSLCSLEVRGSCHGVACAAANFTRGVALLQADGIRSPAHQPWFQSSRTVGGYTINIPWIVTVNPFWSARGQSGFDVLDDAVALPGIPDSKGCGAVPALQALLCWYGFKPDLREGQDILQSIHEFYKCHNESKALLGNWDNSWCTRQQCLDL